jgi:hypothetical protein
MTGRLSENEFAAATIAELSNQVWSYAHGCQPPKDNAKKVRQFGVGGGGVLRPMLTRGQARLKKVIKLSCPVEMAPKQAVQRSILEESLCARRVVAYLKNTPTPLPRFLMDEDKDESLPQMARTVMRGIRK